MRHVLKEIQRLRYDVYCVECGYLAAEDFTEGRESDTYDDFSVHCAAAEAGGKLAGTLRLVLDSPRGFPLERHAGVLDAAFRAVPRGRTAEISRLIVARDGRRLLHTGELGEYSAVLFALFREMNLQSRRLGLDYWLAAMEPSLHRLLRRLLHFAFVPIGEPMEYHGLVVPYIVRIRDVATTLATKRPHLFRYFGFGESDGRGGSALSALRPEMTDAERRIGIVTRRFTTTSSPGMITARSKPPADRGAASMLSVPIV